MDIRRSFSQLNRQAPFKDDAGIGAPTARRATQTHRPFSALAYAKADIDRKPGNRGVAVAHGSHLFYNLRLFISEGRHEEMAMKLEATRQDKVKLGTHGGFRLSNVSFSLSQGQQPGFIIQHVRRKFDVHRLDQGKPQQAAMTPKDITAYIGDKSDPAFPAIVEYWEAWPLAKGDEKTEDSFNLTDFMTNVKLTYYLAGTTGRFTQIGQAVFYASGNPIHVLEVDLGFKLDHTITNGLLYLPSQPDGKKLPTQMSNAVARETSVSWDDSTYPKVNNYKTILAADTP